MRILLVIIALLASPATAKDFSLDDLGSTQVDFLTYGLHALETELRTHQLEICSRSNCRNQKTEHEVSILQNRPSLWPIHLQWPEGGAIIISMSEKYTGSDSSMSTEDGCKTKLSFMRAISFHDSYSYPHLSYARFFVPEKDWRSLKSLNDISPVADKMKAVESRMFLIVTLEHEWNRPNGTLDRMISITCYGSAKGEDFTAMPLRQFPK